MITVSSVKVTTSCSVKFLGPSQEAKTVYSLIQNLLKDGNKMTLDPTSSLVSILPNFDCCCRYDYHIVTVTSVTLLAFILLTIRVDCPKLVWNKL